MPVLMVNTRQQSKELQVFLHGFAATFSLHLFQLFFLIVSLLFHLNLSLVFWFSVSRSFPRILFAFLESLGLYPLMRNLRTKAKVALLPKVFAREQYPAKSHI